MTLQQLIARFRTEANDQTVPYFCSDTDVTDWLNDAVNEACIRARLIHESEDTDITLIAVGDTTAVYELHPSLYEIDHISFKITGETSRLPIRLISTCELDATVTDWRDLEGTPGYAIQSDRTVRLVPKPNVTGTLQMEGFRVPKAPMEGDDDEPEIHPEHHRHLVQWALHKGFSIPDAEFFDKDRAAIADAKFTQYFGMRPDSDLRRKTREDVPQHVQAFWP